MTKNNLITDDMTENTTKKPTKKVSDKATSAKDNKVDMAHFESTLTELETLVARMEKGEQSLEDSIKDFEHGIQLSKKCQVSIEEAEQRVNQLIAKHGDYSPEPFHNSSDDND